jgi:hypothetical protein
MFPKVAGGGTPIYDLVRFKYSPAPMQFAKCFVRRFELLSSETRIKPKLGSMQ